MSRRAFENITCKVAGLTVTINTMIQGGFISMNKKQINYAGNPDKRIIQRRILNGEITEDNLKDYFNSLPDVSYNAEEMAISLEKK
jgi:hypothetical protein